MKRLTCVCLCSVFMLLGGLVSIPLADASSVSWKRIEGVTVPGTTLGGPNVIGGVDSVGFSWSTTKGKAKVNLRSGKLSFKVQGLVLASGTGTLVIGTPSPFVSQVKGTIVCNTTDLPNVVLVDTDAVTLSSRGDAKFSGQVSLPSVCDDMVFLIRVANASAIMDRWIAYGAVRRP